jgi:hypothetical protein
MSALKNAMVLALVNTSTTSKSQTLAENSSLNQFHNYSPPMAAVTANSGQPLASTSLLERIQNIKRDSVPRHPGRVT